jgi:signal transduction histidine kinase
MKRIQEKPVTVLLVDDRAENLLALEALLRRDGLRLLMAHSGAEALELLLTNEVGLAIVDVQMPEMDGFELAELMRGAERSRRIPIIFVTASGHDAQRMFEGYDAGAVDILYKPIEPRILLNKVETFYQLCRQRMELEDTLRFHETFVAAVGHDLRNPLNSIGMVGQILRTTIQDPQQVDMVNRLLASTKRMTLLLDQLYDLSRSRLSGGMQMERRLVDLVPVIRGVVEEMRLTSTNEVRYEQTGSARVYCDDPRIARVVSNLIANAIKHGQKDTPVDVGIKVTGDNIQIEVHNQGLIHKDVLGSLFDPFVSARPHRSGLGLGLFIVDQIVSAHHGRVEVESDQGTGTTFRVTIPRESTTLE